MFSLGGSNQWTSGGSVLGSTNALFLDATRKSKQVLEEERCAALKRRAKLKAAMAQQQVEFQKSPSHTWKWERPSPFVVAKDAIVVTENLEKKRIAQLKAREERLRQDEEEGAKKVLAARLAREKSIKLKTEIEEARQQRHELLGRVENLTQHLDKYDRQEAIVKMADLSLEASTLKARVNQLYSRYTSETTKHRRQGTLYNKKGNSFGIILAERDQLVAEVRVFASDALKFISKAHFPENSKGQRDLDDLHAHVEMYIPSWARTVDLQNQFRSKLISVGYLVKMTDPTKDQVTNR